MDETTLMTPLRMANSTGRFFETRTTVETTINYVSRAPGQLNLAGGADWEVGSDPPPVTDNKHIVIPLMSFVFGFPVLVITILCVIQQRNKWLYERQHIRLQQQRRFSTASTIFTGYPSTSRNVTGSIIQPKDVAIFGHARGSIFFNGDSPTQHRDSVTLQTIQQNGGILVTPNGQRSRKQSAIRFTDEMTNEDEARQLNGAHRPSVFLHPNHSANTRSPLLNVGPQNIMDKFGYVDA